MFGRLLGWHTIYTFSDFGCSCPLTEFYHIQNSLCVQFLRSPILAALLHGTAAADVSQTLRRGTRNGITELCRRRHLCSARQPLRWASPTFLVLLFSSPTLSGRKVDVYHTSTHDVALGRKNYAKKSPSAHHRTTLSGYIFATMARRVDNRKKMVKQQYLLNVTSQYGELWSTNNWGQLASLGHPNKFQRVLRLGFVTAPTSVNGGQTTLHDVWPSYGLVHYTLWFIEMCQCIFDHNSGKTCLIFIILTLL